MQLTMPCVRGCGRRKAGGIYLSLGTRAGGTPIWEFLLDPPVPYEGEKFRGLLTAPDEVREAWSRDDVLLLDMVSAEDYPSAPSLIEEIRRFGLA